ncbi:hypothetical protein sscle_01g010540 [Sclerotinia sclerotiorum 1980 UF-70]|uniref:Uncharacterized protein n=1 Tax=Sclerotinia sclerotiorum (strain ATCC 18683 / 1980 / Ss-1) TaxID=665079 RepID=A0A1D9PU86_SCLS1|nr:hypothetical protein sscle_01g010540 [Sclerotinia sclerotiorum 1980 UF-70]
MIPATDIDSPSSGVFYHRRSSETWPTGYNEPKSADSEFKIPELSLERSQTRHISRTSRFTSRNISDGNKAWHKILPGHGVVALPQSYVEANNIPESTTTHLYDGDKESKHIYFIESYHVLYCLYPILQDMVNQIGRNRIKKCMDWDALRDWAEKWHGDYMDTFDFSDREKELEGYDEVDIYANYREGDGLPVGEL